MKKLLLLSIILVSAFSAFADLNGDGYYRFKNAYTKRYAYMLDDKGSFSVSTTSADVGAIHLYLDTERVLSDPAAVFYLKNSSGSKYDVSAQGTGLYALFEEYIKIHKEDLYDGIQSYTAYAAKSGMVRYLGDAWPWDLTSDRSYASVDCKGSNRLWYINPIDAEGSEYFGVAPSVAVGEKYYQPFYAGFPFSAKSEGLKFYIVKEVDPVGVAVITPLEGVVPSSTPVIVECSSSSASGNRLNIGSASAAANTDGNILKGVYFNNGETGHVNQTPFDRNSMRVLGEVDGKLAFVKGDYDFIPRNQAYLMVTDPTLQGIDNFPVMTASELEAYKVWLSENSVEVIPQDALADVYTIDGRQIKSNFPKTEVSSLPKGLYILRSGKNSEKLLLK